MPSRSEERSQASRAAEQAELDFRPNGGARPGSGRKRAGPRALVPHRERARIASDVPTLVTVRLNPGLASLRRRTEHVVVRAALREASESRRFRVVHYSIQSNHVHLVVEAHDRHVLSEGMNGLLVRIARRLNRHWGRRGSIFADRYHARPLRTPREVRNALVCVLHNARKHGIDYEGADPCSSGPWFDGWAGGWAATAGRCRAGAVKVAPDSKTPAEESARLRDVSEAGAWPARAQTWLLSVGWKRWGLIGLEERPSANRIRPSSRRGRA